MNQHPIDTPTPTLTPTTARLLWFPISILLSSVGHVLTLFLRLIIILVSPIAILCRFVVLPFVHLLRAVVIVVTVPLQGTWLERIETLYIFLGIASLIGCLAGAVLYFVSGFLASSLSIDASSSKTQPRMSRTAAEYRAARRREKREKLDPFSPDRSSPSHVILDRTPVSRRKGLLSQTIVEEEDSDL